MKQLRKRNNYTLSIEAQEIIDKIPKSKKSSFISEAVTYLGAIADNSFVNDILENTPIYEHPDGCDCERCLDAHSIALDNAARM